MATGLWSSWGTSVARAQGVTGAAVTGTISGEGVGPLETAAVQLRNTATGEVFSTVSGPGGRYFIDNVPPGPYTLTASFSGFPLTNAPGITLALGQRLNLDLNMKLNVEEVTVIEHLDPLQDKARTGATTIVGQQKIQDLPLQGRNFTDLIATSPQAQSGSIGGQNNRYNNIQIDGAVNSDIFGLSASGTPGGQSNAKPLSIEAIDQFIVQVAPFDVRQGNFVGGLVNAVTKSGTNEFHGSAFFYFQNKELTGNGFHQGSTIYNYNQSHCDSANPTTTPDTCQDTTYNDFHVYQYGGSVGGPIIKDKLHFFVAFDLQSRESSFGNSANITGVDSYDLAHAGFTKATADQFVSILKNTYGVNAGDSSSPPIENPDHNVFAKLTWTIDDHNRLEASYNLVDASLDVLTRAPTSPSLPSVASPVGRLRDGYELSDSGYSQVNQTNSVRLKLTSHWGDVSNEAIAGVSFVRDHRDIGSDLPLIIVQAGTIGSSPAFLAAGGERFSQANILDQDVYQIQDNASFSLNAWNRLTVGTSNDIFHFRNTFLQAASGVWSFASLDDFAAGTAQAYQRRFSGSPDQQAGTANFTATQIGIYAQDEMTPIKGLTLTPGLRIDIPFLGSNLQNPALVNNPAFPIDTSKVPSGNLLWSPRLGFNWDVENNSDTIIRGGVGLFTGQPPYVWISNAYGNNGLAQVELDCVRNPMTNMGVPTFTANSRNQPGTCTGGNGAAPPLPTNLGEIDYFDPDTKYPQSFQAALGADRRLPWGLVGTLDFLYSHDVNAWYITDANLKNQGVDSQGRPLYGAPNMAATALVPVRFDPTHLSNAVKVYNQGGGQVVSLTLQLAKTINKFLDVSLAYTYSHSTDLISMTSSQALSNFQFEPVDGSLESRNARPSAFDRPHKITLTGTVNLPAGFNVGIQYLGAAGTPYTWLVQGDANGDGQTANDLVFVPANANQITLQNPNDYQKLQDFINTQECLRDARGGFVERGACRNPWTNFVNLRIAWGIKVVRDQRFSVQADIFNFLNLLNADWGTSDAAATFENANTTFLRVVGWDTANNRAIYSFAAPAVVTSRTFSPTSSRWRIQLGARYDF